MSFIHLPDGDSDPSDPDSSFIDPHTANPDDYFDILLQLSQDWLSVQLTHKVSCAATNAFWKLSLKWIGRLLHSKKINRVKRKIPQFRQQRNKLYKDCPRIGMNFGYLNTDTNEILTLTDVDTAPRKRFQNDLKYEKLYEAAFIKVIFNMYILTSPFM